MYGIEKGNNQYGYEKNSHPKITQEQLASQMDMDVRTLQNYKMLADMIPELDELVSTGILGDNATIIDAMDWMHTHQLSSKNLTAGEKLAMTMELQKEIALENEKKRKETEGRPRKENCTPIGVQNTDDNRSRSDTWTDSQTAKKAGVGVGTVARYKSGYLYMNLY